MSKQKIRPEIINLSSTDLEEIKSRLTNTILADADKKIILSILSTYQWLYRQLQMSKFSMHKLKAVFGFKTDKRSNLTEPKTPENLTALLSEPTENNAALPTTSNDRELIPKKQ